MAYSMRILWYLSCLPFGLPFPQVGLLRRRNHRILPSQQDDFNEAMDALQDFHVGTWQSTGAFSFTVSNDVAAGVLDRFTSASYTCPVKFQRNGNSVVLSEIYFMDADGSTGDMDRTREEVEYERTIVLSNSNFDIDSVDGSYSLDGLSLPIRQVLGLSTITTCFGIEHCIAVNDDARARCFLLYSMETEQLCRIVVCHETRMSEEMDPVVNIPELRKYNISLLELCSGVWRGDAVIRDVFTVQMSPISESRKGFGVRPSTTHKTKAAGNDAPPLCSWTLGVQKINRRLEWNFEDEIRQVNELGRGMGAPMENTLATLNRFGAVCSGGPSRRTPPSDRIVYVDWEDAVGFLWGSVALYAPRFRKFDFSRRIRPFYTEFAVFQSNTTNPISDGSKQELVCSKISRVYNYQGALKQGVLHPTLRCKASILRTHDSVSLTQIQMKIPEVFSIGSLRLKCLRRRTLINDHGNGF